MYGTSVATFVDGVTKASPETNSRASRSAEDLRKVLTFGAYDVRVLIIKFADRLHNMYTLGHMPAAKQRRISEETRAVYVPLAERLGIHVWKTEFEKLCCRYLNGYAYDLAARQNEQTADARMRGLRYIKQYFSTLVMDRMEEGAILNIEMNEDGPKTKRHHPTYGPPCCATANRGP